MKTSLLLISCLCTMTAWGVESIPNGSFENWDSHTYEFPAYYPYNSNADRIYDETATSNVFKTLDAQNGTYAVRLVTTEASESTNFGYFLNAPTNGEPSTWKGGIPISEKPTGIHGYYKYNVALGDTALIIVKFSKNGNEVGTYFFPLTGIHTTYTEFNFDFNPVLTETPDSIILGFTSSMAINEISLPGSELFIDNVTLNGVTSQPAQLNGNFEDWTSRNILTPHDWISQSNNPEACKRSTDAYAGSYAIELNSYMGESDGQPQARPGEVANGSWNNNTNQWEGGISYINTNNLLTFNYKYSTVQPGEAGELWVQFMKNGQQMGGNNIPLPATDVYKTIQVPFNWEYFLSPPDKIIIGFKSNMESDTRNASLGSRLIIDALELKEGGSGPTTPVTPANVENGNFELWDTFSFDYPEFYPFNSVMQSNKDQNQTPTVNVFKTNDAYHGNSALRLVTNLTIERNNFGFALNAMPNNDDPSLWTGGIPINEKPTGIKGYFKYNVASGDTAIIIASFSKAGRNIGSYFLPLSGLHTSYTPFDLTFEPAMTEVPDSMILGYASSWSQTQIGINGSELYIDNVSLNGITTQPSKMNGDFESWITNSTETPQSWFSQNDNSESCIKTSDAFLGEFAVELHSYLGENNGHPVARPGSISNATWVNSDNGNGKWIGGTPFTNAIDTLAFYYKYTPAQPMDSAQVYIQFMMGNENFWGSGLQLPASSVYKYIEIPIMIQHPFMRADTAVINLQTGLWSDSLTTHVGSILIVDAIHFKSNGDPVSIVPVKKEVQAKVFPNPSNGLFRVNLTDNVAEGLDIYNLSGQKVISLGKGQIQTDKEIDMTLYPRGIYLIKINDGKKTYMEKLILK